MANLLVRKALRSIGLLESARTLKRRFRPPDRVFAPCTPHLLIAVNRGLRWCSERGLAEGSDYLEFGVYRGFTFWYTQALAADMGIRDLRFFGFDSFFGLPRIEGPDIGGEFQEGAYTCARRDVEMFLTTYGVDWDKTHLVEGWYDETLTRATRQRYQLRRCSLCVIDCDLYSSARLVLEFLGPLVGEACVMLFDDWTSFENQETRGEQKAFTEFLQVNPKFSAEPFIEFGGHGKGFIVRRSV